MVTYNLNGIPEEERMFDDEDEDITTVFDFYTFTSKEDFNTWYGDYGRGPQRKPVSYTYVSISEVRNRVWNQQYNEFINKGLEATNEPFGFGLYFSSLLNFAVSNTTTNARIPWMKQSCSQCQNGYGLSTDHSACLPCPQGCLLCLYSSQCIATTK